MPSGERKEHDREYAKIRGTVLTRRAGRGVHLAVARGRTPHVDDDPKIGGGRWSHRPPPSRPTPASPVDGQGQQVGDPAVQFGGPLIHRVQFDGHVRQLDTLDSSPPANAAI